MSAILVFITIILVFFFLANIYIIHLQKKHYYIKTEMISEDKVTQYILYLSTIIEKREEEIRSLDQLKEENPEDKSIDLLISRKQQEKNAVRGQMSEFVAENDDNLAALQAERSFLLSENDQLQAKISHLDTIAEFGRESGASRDLRKRYEEIRTQYEKLQQEYEITKKTLDQLDEQFTNLYHEE